VVKNIAIIIIIYLKSKENKAAQITQITYSD